VNVRPSVELHGLEVVQVLTAAPGSRPARREAAIAAVPAPGQSGEGGKEEGASSSNGYAQVEGG
jgi:hypothetical protein